MLKKNSLQYIWFHFLYLFSAHVNTDVSKWWYTVLQENTAVITHALITSKNTSGCVMILLATKGPRHT